MKLKSGIKTSEFWIVIAAGVVQLAMTALGYLDTEWAAGGVTVLASVYAVMRGLSRNSQSQ